MELLARTRAATSSRTGVGGPVVLDSLRSLSLQMQSSAKRPANAHHGWVAFFATGKHRSHADAQITHSLGTPPSPPPSPPNVFGENIVISVTVPDRSGPDLSTFQPSIPSSPTLPIPAPPIIVAEDVSPREIDAKVHAHPGPDISTFQEKDPAVMQTEMRRERREAQFEQVTPPPSNPSMTSNHPELAAQPCRTRGVCNRYSLGLVCTLAWQMKRSGRLSTELWDWAASLSPSSRGSRRASRDDGTPSPRRPSIGKSLWDWAAQSPPASRESSSHGGSVFGGAKSLWDWAKGPSPPESRDGSKHGGNIFEQVSCEGSKNGSKHGGTLFAPESREGSKNGSKHGGTLFRRMFRRSQSAGPVDTSGPDLSTFQSATSPISSPVPSRKVSPPRSPPRPDPAAPGPDLSTFQESRLGT